MQLIRVDAEVSSEGKDETKGVMPSHWCTCRIIVEALDAGIAIAYTSCLISFNVSICILFNLTYLLTSNRLSSSR